MEEYRLIGGKGDGMRLLQVRNGLGLEFTVSPDRAADITRLSYEGVNYSYISPSGYVAPAYYDQQEFGIFKILYLWIFDYLRFVQYRRAYGR